MKVFLLLGISFSSLVHVSQADVAKDVFAYLNSNKTSLQVTNLPRNGIHLVTLRGEYCSLEALANSDPDYNYNGQYQWVDGAIGKDKSWAMYNIMSDNKYADKRIWIQCDSEAPIPNLVRVMEDIMGSSSNTANTIIGFGNSTR